MTRQTATAFAPASIGNVAVGFDMLGLAVAGAGDTVSVTRTPTAGVRVADVRDPQGKPHPDLQGSDADNTAAVAAGAVWDAGGEAGGLALTLAKGIPLKSGMGSSAASAVAGAVAANALLPQPFSLPELMPFALAGETVASGTPHADNVAPSLFGGLVLSPPALSPRCIEVPVSSDIVSVLVHPDLHVSTADARNRLAQRYSMEDWLTQQGYLAAFLLGLVHNDHALIAESLKDVLIEPQRSDAVPGFAAVKNAAMQAGALGGSLSGSGPSLFALCTVERASDVAAAMKAAFVDAGHDCESWTSALSAPGARLVDDEP